MNILLIGCGSIGKRHAANLLEIIPQAKFYIIRSNAIHDEFTTSINAKIIKDWEALPCKPDLAIFANPSAFRMAHLEKMIEFNVPAYIEKPLVTHLIDLDSLKKHLKAGTYNQPTLVGCNLRYLPSIQLLRRKLSEGVVGNLCRAIFEVGQYLPTWRPDQNYQTSYSAQRQMGGGVILDLVHELDLVRYLLGEFEVVSTLSGKLSHLNIDVEDTAVIHLTRPSGPFVSVQMDYVSRFPTRNIKIVGDEGSLIWDLCEKRLQLNTAEGVELLSDHVADFDVKQTYKKAMQELINAIQQGGETSVPLQEGINTTQLMLSCKLKESEMI